MNRSELFANYDNFGKDITTVSYEEFYSLLNKNTFRNYEDGNTGIQKYSIEGYDYFLYGTTYNVGWQGDVDCDSYYCKIKTMTQAERDELYNLCKSPGFGY